MEVPYTIASLPKPLDAEKGRIQAAPVFAYRGLKKRKRHELVVGVDGETVNIYNIQSQGLLTTYHIPPQAYLCCPPCSIYSRRVGETPAQRHTFVVLKDSKPATKRRLLRFTEKLNGDSDFEKEAGSELSVRDGDIVGLEALPTSSDEASLSQLLVSYADGGVDCISEDMSRIVWSHRPSGAAFKDAVVAESVALVDLDTARKGILKSREDIAASLTPGSAGAAPLLFQILRTQAGVAVHVFRIRSTTASAVGLARSGLELLGAIEPSHDDQLATDVASNWELHANSGQLCRLSGGVLAVYDLSTVVPKLLSTFGSPSAPISSFARLSSSSLITVTDDIAKIYETRYGSLQCSRSLTETTSSDSSTRKRKRDETMGAHEAVHMISHFSDLGLVAAMSGTGLLGLQISTDLRNTRRSKTQGVLLIDVMGKGAMADDLAGGRKTQNNEKRAKKWEAWCVEVDSLAEKRDVLELERFIAKDIKIATTPGDDDAASVASSNGTNGHLETGKYSWILPAHRPDFDNEKRRKALYLLSTIFAHEEAHVAHGQRAGAIVVKILAPNIIRWLAYHSMLGSTLLQQTLQSTVRPGELIYALGKADDSLELLHDVLGMPSHLELEEIVQALKLLIQSLDTPSMDDSILALPSTAQSNGDTAMTNGDADSHLELESHAAEKELNHAIAALQSGLEVRSDSLRSVLARLHAFPKSSIKHSMGSMMSQKEIIFFIHVLRIEMADGGWTTRYVDDGSDEYGERKMIEAADRAMGGPSDQAIRTIGDLLVCALDAIGASGWIVGLAGQDGTEQIIQSLKAEISACFEACFEAEKLANYLAEFEGYATKLGATRSEGKKRKRGKILEMDPEEFVLPMGGHVEAPAPKNKKGGPLSKVEFAREQNMKVGKYSIDRIRFHMI